MWKFHFWVVKNCTKFEGKILPSHICQKRDIYWQKTCCWCQWNLRFCTQANYPELKKTVQNNFFHWGQQHCENGIWNLQIFAVIYSTSKIFDVFFWGKCSTRPYILFTSFLQLAWIETDSSVNLSSAVGCIQLVPKYISKVKLDRGQPPNSLSEIIIPGKNGCCGVNIPISHFLLSLTHSAMTKFKNIARGTTDPGYWLRILSYL